MAAAPARWRNAAAAVVDRPCRLVVVYRALAQGQFGRFGQGSRPRHRVGRPCADHPLRPDVTGPVVRAKVIRFMHEHKIGQEALRAIAMASYHHAQANPRAVMRGRPLTEQSYDDSRWITEPFTCSIVAWRMTAPPPLILVSAERASDLKHKPAYVLAVAHRLRPSRASTPAGFAHRTSPARISRPSQSTVGHGRASARRMSTCAVLREFHRRRADEPGRARLLRAPKRRWSS